MRDPKTEILQNYYSKFDHKELKSLYISYETVYVYL